MPAAPLGHPAPGSNLLEFRDPWDVAVSGDGTLHVADRGNHRVQRIRRAGTSLARCNPLSRQRKTLPGFDQTFEKLLANLAEFDPAKVRYDEIRSAAAIAASVE